jgi:hypothetical protein
VVIGADGNQSAVREAIIGVGGWGTIPVWSWHNSHNCEDASAWFSMGYLPGHPACTYRHGVGGWGTRGKVGGSTSFCCLHGMECSHGIKILLNAWTPGD